MKKLNLNKALRIFFSNALKITMSSPGQAFSFLKTLIWMGRAARLRAKWKKQDVHVPPIIIFSVTHQCNMECRGCYDRTFHAEDEEEIDDEKLRAIVQEAKELGVSFFVIAGGEPFMRPALLEVTQDFPEIIFLVFTNGVLIKDKEIRALKKQKHVIPLVSLEGSEQDTDQRRGEGTFRAVQVLLGEMKREGIFFGTSLTLTRHSFPTILDQEYIHNLVEAKSRFFLFLEYTPTEEGTEDWVLSQAQRDQVPALLDSYRKRFPALFIAVPWDEEDVGGCLSALLGSNGEKRGGSSQHDSACGKIFPP
jgi:MoaA/NifB/PqqE/SkfB family radical SAM enzyme